MKHLTKQGVIGNFLANYETSAYMERVRQLAFINDDSNSAKESYAWLGGVPGLKEGGAKVGSERAKEWNYDIKNRKFDGGVPIAGDDWRRDKTGQVANLVNIASQQAATHWFELITDLVKTGESTNAYDGQPFWDGSHPTKSSTQSNMVSVTVGASLPVTTSGTAANPSAQTLAYAATKGIEAIRNLQDWHGNYPNEMGVNYLVLAPGSYFAAANVANASLMFGNSEPNPIKAGKQSVEILTSPRLNSLGNKLAVFRVDTHGKPFIAQSEVPLNVDFLDEDSEHFKKKDELLLILKAIRNAGYGEYLSSSLVTLS